MPDISVAYKQPSEVRVYNYNLEAYRDGIFFSERTEHFVEFKYISV